MACLLTPPVSERKGSWGAQDSRWSREEAVGQSDAKYNEGRDRSTCCGFSNIIIIRFSNLTEASGGYNWSTSFLSYTDRWEGRGGIRPVSNGFEWITGTKTRIALFKVVTVWDSKGLPPWPPMQVTGHSHFKLLRRRGFPAGRLKVVFLLMSVFPAAFALFHDCRFAWFMHCP